MYGVIFIIEEIKFQKPSLNIAKSADKTQEEMQQEMQAELPVAEQKKQLEQRQQTENKQELQMLQSEQVTVQEEQGRKQEQEREDNSPERLPMNPFAAFQAVVPEEEGQEQGQGQEQGVEEVSGTATVTNTHSDIVETQSCHPEAGLCQAQVPVKEEEAGVTTEQELAAVSDALKKSCLPEQTAVLEQEDASCTHKISAPDVEAKEEKEEKEERGKVAINLSNLPNLSHLPNLSCANNETREECVDTKDKTGQESTVNTLPDPSKTGVGNKEEPTRVDNKIVCPSESNNKQATTDVPALLHQPQEEVEEVVDTAPNQDNNREVSLLSSTLQVQSSNNENNNEYNNENNNESRSACKREKVSPEEQDSVRGESKSIDMSLNSKQYNLYGPFLGQVIGTMKDCCRKAFLNGEPRLFEAVYRCLFQMKIEHIGQIYSVINKRRGTVNKC